MSKREWLFFLFSGTRAHVEATSNHPCPAQARAKIDEARRARDAFLSHVNDPTPVAPPTTSAVVMDNDALEQAKRDVLFPHKAAAARRKDVGDASSGVDAAFAQLGLGGAPSKAKAVKGATQRVVEEEEDGPPAPDWVREADARHGEPNKWKRWLRERGYGAVSGAAPSDKSAAIAALAAAQRGDAHIDEASGGGDDDDDAAAERSEEREALESIYADGELEASDDARPGDVTIQVAAYEAPDAAAPPLTLQVFVDGVAGRYPRGDVPAVALSGGGLSEAALRALATTVATYAKDNVDNGMLVFELLACAADEAQAAATKAEADRAKAIEAAKQARRAAVLGTAQPSLPPPPPEDAEALERKRNAARTRKAQDAQKRLGAFGAAAPPRPGGANARATAAKAKAMAAALDDDYLYGDGNDSDDSGGDDFGVVKMEL